MPKKLIPDPSEWHHLPGFPDPARWCPITREWYMAALILAHRSQKPQEAEVAFLQEWADAEHRDHRKELTAGRMLNSGRTQKPQKPQDEWIEGYHRYYFSLAFLHPSSGIEGEMSRLHNYKHPVKNPTRKRLIFKREILEGENSREYLARLAYVEMHPLWQLMRERGYNPSSLARKMKKSPAYIWQKLEHNRCDTEIFLNHIKKIWPKTDWGKYLKDLYVWYATDYLEDPVHFVAQAMETLDKNFGKIKGRKYFPNKLK